MTALLPSVKVDITPLAGAGSSIETQMASLVGRPANQQTFTLANQIWTNWSTIQNSACYTNAASNTIWNNWNSGISNATAVTATLYTTNNLVWASWNTNSAIGITNNGYFRAAVETPEQVAAREAQQRQYAAEQATREAERRAVRAEADKRAEALLRAHLTPEQQAQLSTKDWFLIHSKSGKVYRINRGRNANIDVIDETGKTVRSLCVHPRDAVPDADTMLAQKVMIEHDEESVLKMAITHGAQHGWRRGPVPEPIELPVRKPSLIERALRLVA